MWHNKIALNVIKLIKFMSNSLDMQDYIKEVNG
jgi:hypothetical protein